MWKEVWSVSGYYEIDLERNQRAHIHVRMMIWKESKFLVLMRWGTEMRHRTNRKNE